jgi:CheY-like chemotaxis protein
MATLRILIVEDETMIAMLVEDFLKDLGWNVVGLAGTLDRALAMARDADIDAALLDVNLNGQDTFAVADILSERDIPFVFATGYGADGVTARFRGVPTLTKPFQRVELDRALNRAMTGSVDGRFADPGSVASPGKRIPPGC